MKGPKHQQIYKELLRAIDAGEYVGIRVHR
ncbi:MAG: hypothetical protein V7641_3364 [Blastocatellia bacterium]